MNDPLSALLAVAGVRGALISRAALTRPFGVAAGVQHRAIFHTPRLGSAVLAVDGSPPVRVEPGDVAVLPRGTAHTVTDAVGTPCRPIGSHAVVLDEGKLPTVINGDGAVDLDLLCGTFHLGAPADDWLLGPLPDLFVVRGVGEAARFVDATLGLMAAELASGGLGTFLVSDRLVEVLVVYLLRAWATENADRAVGWVAGMKDPQLGPVLAAVHADPAALWSLERMAKTAGLSRTRFTARFRERVGLSPGVWTTAWRIAVARRALHDGADVAQAAERAGYASEASFSRAFKRMVGQSPGAWRSQSTPT